MIDFQHEEIGTYIETLTDFQKDLVLEMREAVLSASPVMKEGIKWGSIAYFNKKNICGYRVAKNHVTLLFMEGAQLTDPKNILAGDGAKARTYKCAKGETVDHEGIRILVEECLERGM